MNTVEVETTAAKEEIKNSKKIAIRFLNECDFSSDTLAFIFMGFLGQLPQPKGRDLKKPLVD